MKVIRWLLFLLLLIGVLLLVQPDDAITPTFVQRADQFSASLDYQARGRLSAGGVGASTVECGRAV